MAKLEPTAQELLSAWEKGVERALTDAACTGDLDNEMLQSVAGMHIASGLKGGLGLWGQSENKTECTCPPCY